MLKFQLQRPFLSRILDISPSGVPEGDFQCNSGNFSISLLRKVRFFLGGRAGASEGGGVICESKHQKGRVLPLCKLFKGRVTHLFHIFLMRGFVMLFSIFLTD